MIKSGQIFMNTEKVKAVLDYPQPKSVKDVQSFLGMANSNRRFIANFSEIVKPLTSLLKKDVPFKWSSIQDVSFNRLKTSFTNAPILTNPDPSLQFILETDASDFALGAVLSQRHEGELHPVCFYSRSLTTAELNYNIHDKELLAIISSLVHWRQYLLGAHFPVLVLCDHKNLEYFLTSTNLNRRQCRWASFMADFDLEITYRPGNLNIQADLLSRNPSLKPKISSTIPINPFPSIFKSLASISVNFVDSPDFLTQVKSALQMDMLAKDLLFDSCYLNDSSWKYNNGLLFKKDLLYVPTEALRLLVLKHHHDSLTSGHFGILKTTDLVTRRYWWPGLRKMIRTYVNSCDICQRAKTSRHKPYGLLKPLPIPERPWSSISLDFITDLPVSNGYDCILVIVDRLTKMSHFIPCHKTITSSQTVDAFLKFVFKYHGAPDTIISDRGPQFIAAFWRRFLELLNCKPALYTAFHPETDGQTERVNQTLEGYLRCYVNYHQDNWTDLLTFAEIAYNNSIHSSTQCSPYFANTGYNPNFDFLIPNESIVPSAEMMAKDIHEVHSTLKEILLHAQSEYKHYADQLRSTAPFFSEGDKVWLNAKSLRTTRPSKKLDYRRIGPCRILRQINEVAFELDLPSTLGNVHNVFHVSLLEKYQANTLAGREEGVPEPVVIEDHFELEVDQILNSKYVGHALKYLVR